MIGAAVILLFLRNLSSAALLVSIVLTFFVGVFIQYSGNYHLYQNSVWDDLFNYNWFHRNLLFFSYPFFCLGYLINKNSLHELVSLKSAVVLAVLGFFALVGESYFNYYQEGRDGGFDSFVSLILVCPAIFILCMKVRFAGRSKNIAKYSSAIYFVHAFALSLFQDFTEFGGTLLTVAVILASVIVSFFVIKLNGRLKFIL